MDDKHSDATFNEYIFTSWLSKIFGNKKVCLGLTNSGLYSVFKDGTETKVSWKSHRSIPKVSRGFLFYKTTFDDDVSFNFLTRNQAQEVSEKILKGWYSANYQQFSKLLVLIQRKLYSGYIRSSELRNFFEQINVIVGRFKKPPSRDLVPRKIFDTYAHLYDLEKNFKSRVEAAREHFIQTECGRYESYFDEVESNPLTQSQRAACVVDDDNNLVLAGAGTGKTSVMVAKAGYLINSGRAKPEEVLLLAYGNKAASELDERIKEKLKTDSIKASTFHSIGRRIIHEVEGQSIPPSDLATDNDRFFKFVDTTLQALLEDEGYADIAITYFEQYLYPIKNIFDFQSHGEYIDYLKNNDFRSLKGDMVKSYGELLIANFLFTNGIEYQYEANYKIDIPDSNFKSYKPDFYLPESDIYIEHFGTDKDGNTAPWIDKETYRKQIEWKRRLHPENDTLMLETFYYQQTEGILLEHLESELRKYDVEFSPLPNESIFETLREFGRLKALSILLANLIQNIKSCCLTEKEIENLANQSSHPEHSRASLALLKPIINAYEEELERSGEIDFNDMIHRALNYLDENKYTPIWKYILVDEFQDISDPRARLVKKLRDKVNKSSVFCVGDDWQSIYRFSGSDLRFTTNFRSLFGEHSTSTLDKTFRFNNMIGKVASDFVSKNPSQVRKNIESHIKVDKPMVSIFKTENCAGIDEIRTVLRQISLVAEKGATVFILARFSHLLPEQRSRLKNEFPGLKISGVMSMHASKGKEADYVIILGVEKGKFGFPSEKTTHPLLEVYLPNEEDFDNAEERRLFYVAITRAKHKSYILANMKKPSSFASELLEDGYQVIVDDFPTDPAQKTTEQLKCPSCESGVLVDRESESGKFTGCNNYPYCNYTRNSCKRCESKLIDQGEFRVCETESCDFKVKICDRCETGDMVLRERRSDGKKFWGCSNYRFGEHNSCDNSFNYIDFEKAG